MNETLKTIFARKSVRHFRNEPVTKEQLELIVRAGMAAPTAVDKRPWDFIVITDKEMLNRLAAVLPYAKMAATASAGIIVVGDLERQNRGPASDYWIQDCVAATENILLAIESLGLGAVWTALYPNRDRIDPVREMLNIPAKCEPLCFIPVGVPDGSEKPKDKWDASKLHYNGW